MQNDNDISFFGQIVDTAEDVIYSFGERTRNAVDADSLRIELARTHAQLAAKKQIGDERRKDQALNIGKNVIYAFVAILLIIVMAKFLKPIINK